MSRYLILLILNLPLILLALLGAITRYKLKNISKKRFLAQIIMWTIVLIGLASTEFIYTWLFRNNYTSTEPLSLFDVIQITSIVVVFYLVNRSRARIETLEKRVQNLHQELSIRLSKK